MPLMPQSVSAKFRTVTFLSFAGGQRSGEYYSAKDKNADAGNIFNLFSHIITTFPNENNFSNWNEISEFHFLKMLDSIL